MRRLLLLPCNPPGRHLSEPSSSPLHIQGLGAIIDAYDAILVDQWAVMHNGMQPIPGALDALEAVVANGQWVVSLSNSSRSRRSTLENLAEMGFLPGTHFHGVVTSGCDVRDCLADRPDPFYAALGNRYYMMAWGNHRSLTEQLPGYEEVDDIEKADFIFCSGIDFGRTPADYRLVLEAALKRTTEANPKGLPMICSNPDKWSLAPDGKLYPCPGAIAELYEQLGGNVRWHGKPHRSAYMACARIIAELDAEAQRTTKKVLAIGDSLEHDIAGGDQFGHDTLLIGRGIHNSYFTPQATPAAQDQLYAQYGVRPTYVLHKLVW